LGDRQLLAKVTNTNMVTTSGDGRVIGAWDTESTAKTAV